MRTLMIDVGGSNVKLLNAADGEMRKIRSHRDLGAAEMVECVRNAVQGWDYDQVSVGFPSLVRHGRPVREPLNLGGGWVEFDYDKAFEHPVRFINDAAMQALGNYVAGRLLFIGFGTSVGCCLIADDVILPAETGLIKIGRGLRLVDTLSKAALKRFGRARWERHAAEAIELLRDVFHPDETVLGGGNAKRFASVPFGCRTVDNRSAYRGAERLWEGADLVARPSKSTWKIEHRA